MENKIILLQRNFLKRNLRKKLDECKNILNEMTVYTLPPQHINMFDPEKQKDQRFRELQIIMKNPSNIRKFNALLSSIYRLTGSNKDIAPKINGRKLITAWLIVSFPEYILEIVKPDNKDKENEYPYDIFFISESLIDNLNFISSGNMYNEAIRKFKKSLNKYSNAVNYFLLRDKSEMIQKLINEYINMNKTIKGIEDSDKYSEDEKNQSISIISKSKETIVSHLKKLDSDINLPDLEIQSQIQDAFTSNMEKALTDILIKDIENKKFSHFGKVVDEITNNLLRLGASKIDGEFKDRMDTEFIIQKMSYLNTTKSDIEDYGDYIIKIINQLQAPIDIDETNDKWDQMKFYIDDNCELLGKLISFVSKEIQTIISKIDDFRAVSEAGINIF